MTHPITTIPIPSTSQCYPFYLHLIALSFLFSFVYSFPIVSHYSGGLVANLHDSLPNNLLNDLLVSLPHNPVPLLHGVTGWLGKEVPMMC